MDEILIVDDERDNLEIAKQILEMAGITAQYAFSGEEALRQIKKKAFLLMITDLNMPEMNGLELSRRALAIAPQLHIIMCTGSISSEIPRQAEEAGIAMVLYKPLHPMKMLEAVMRVIGNAGGRA